MRRIKSAEIKFLTLCKRGKNRMPVILKEDDGTVQFETITKAGPDFETNGELLAVAYPNGYRDTEGDIATKEACKSMAYSFMKSGANLDIRHNEVKIEKSRAYVAENFLIQQSDPRFEGFKDYNDKPVDVTGSWAVLIKIDDPELRKLYKEDGWNGVSLQGTAELEEDNDHVKKALDFYRKNVTDRGNDEMTPEQIAQLSKSIVDGMTAALTPLLTPKKEEPPVKKEDEKKELEPPKFVGSMSKTEDVLAHAKKMRIFNLQKTVDVNDPKALENFATQLEQIEKEEDGEDEEDEEVKNARRVLAKHEGRSDLPPNENGKTPVKKGPLGQRFKLTKEEEEGEQHGMRMAAFLNKQHEEARK